MEEHSVMIRNTKGYYTVEAAVFLPVFLLAVLTLGYFVKAAGVQSDVIHAAADECRLAAVKAYHLKTASDLPVRVSGRIRKENQEISSFSIRRFRDLHEKDGNQGMIDLSMEYAIAVRLPLQRKKKVCRSDQLLCRAWIGRSREGTAMSFQEMMEEEGGGDVWVFPYSGARYHTQDCSFIRSYPVQTVLNDSIRDKVKPCRKCRPGELGTGSLIYCFRYGDVYHRGGCRIIDKYTIVLSREQAEERGYQPCRKCGGKTE